MDHSLLKDKVYLYLLAFYNNQKTPKYVELGKKIHMTRQTVSKRIKNLFENNIIQEDENGILKVNNILKLDTEMLASILVDYPSITFIELEEVLFLNKDKNKIISNLSISKDSYYSQLSRNEVIYGIVSEGIIKYVGCTQNYEKRIKQHIRKRPFLSCNNFIILKQLDDKDNNRFDYEKALIKILQPEWNIASK